MMQARLIPQTNSKEPTRKPKCCVSLKDSSRILRGKKADQPDAEETFEGSSREPASTCKMRHNAILDDNTRSH